MSHRMMLVQAGGERHDQGIIFSFVDPLWNHNEVIEMGPSPFQLLLSKILRVAAERIMFFRVETETDGGWLW